MKHTDCLSAAPRLGLLLAALILAAFGVAARAAQPVITQVATGYVHSCALDESGQVCAGDIMAQVSSAMAPPPTA